MNKQKINPGKHQWIVEPCYAVSWSESINKKVNHFHTVQNITYGIMVNFSKENVSILIFLSLLYFIYLIVKVKLPSKVLITREKEQYFMFENNSLIRLWIDVPNSFPWRKCLNVYDSHLYTYSCDRRFQYDHQTFTIITSPADNTKFQLYWQELELDIS